MLINTNIQTLITYRLQCRYTLRLIVIFTQFRIVLIVKRFPSIHSDLLTSKIINLSQFPNSVIDAMETLYLSLSPTNVSALISFFLCVLDTCPSVCSFASDLFSRLDLLQGDPIFCLSVTDYDVTKMFPLFSQYTPSVLFRYIETLTILISPKPIFHIFFTKFTC